MTIDPAAAAWRCPGHCGREISEKFCCPECWDRLPVEHRDEIRRWKRLGDMVRYYGAQADARGWFDAQLPAGHREFNVTTGLTHQWTGSMWRLVPKSELDAEAWRRSRGQA